MATSESVKSASKGHQLYRLASGLIVPSVTTIVGGASDKSGLIAWAVKMTKAGLDPNKVRDLSAIVGTTTHQLCEQLVFGASDIDKGDIAPNLYNEANRAYKNFELWYKAQSCFLPIAHETQLVSEKYEFGGTLDMVVQTKSGLKLIDIKTSNSVWPKEHYPQVVAYAALWQETHQEEISEISILHIPKEPETNCIEYAINGECRRDSLELFLAMLKVYNLKKRIK